MTRPYSFRTRLLVGALLIAAGLLGLVGIISTWAAHTFPNLHEFAHGALLLIFSAAFIAGGLALLRRSLAPFDRLRTRLTAVRDGSDPTIAGEYPAEVQPLISDLNALLVQRERAVSRAVARAGDLAHGLKTPLAVLAQDASRARAAGQSEIADSIEQQVDRMRRLVDHHLSQARVTASGATLGARCAVAESAEAVARTLRQLHADRGVAVEVDVAPTHAARVRREDLDEMIGNLLDNACRYASSKARVTSTVEADRIVLSIDDDGPGVPEAMWDQVLRRGVRADEVPTGSGLGLAIVRDLAELYGGTLSLERSPLGGLRARLILP